MIFDIPEDYCVGNYDGFDLKKFEEKFYSALRGDLDKYLVERSSYVLGGFGVGMGELCLGFDNPFWVVCISEKGKRINPAFFSGYRDAANYLIWSLVRVRKGDFPKFNMDLW